jgi:hypothetical protein
MQLTTAVGNWPKQEEEEKGYMLEEF